MFRNTACTASRGVADPEFLLTTVFVPAGRQNLTAILVARCDPQAYGELVLYNIAVEEQVPGPRQVEALVEQDPVISQQFSLWRQGGSQVWSGHLHIVPVGRNLLYLEPIFLAAEADAIPELRRFVVSDGRRVAMEPTLEEAIAALALAGGGEAPVLSLVGEVEETQLSPTGWPREALDLLDEAENRLREGDWAGFGAALDGAAVRSQKRFRWVRPRVAIPTSSPTFPRPWRPGTIGFRSGVSGVRFVQEPQEDSR